MNERNFDKINVENHAENILAENVTLKWKLDSKCQALLILNKELDDCRTERDQYKLMAEKLQEKCSALKKISYSKNNLFIDGNNEMSASVPQDSREINKSLKFEVENLRQKLRDALGDVKALRSKLNQQKWSNSENDTVTKKLDKEEELVKQLEAMNKVKSQLEIDLQSVLDEKEELITERDAYKCKVHRLNHEFNVLLKGENRSVIDLDALIMENRFLQEHLQQAQEENKLANQTISRYKNMLEKKRNKGTVKFGTENISGMLLSQKQVQEFLENCLSEQSTSNPSTTISDLRSVSIALLESLNDKSLALSHQKRANRILAARICELEQRLENIRGAEVITFPSKVLLEGYSGCDVDKDAGVKIPDGISINKTPKHDPKENVRNITGINESQDEENALPPELAELVQKALNDIATENGKNSP